MLEEKVYKLKNGKEMILIQSVKIDDVRYLLLCDNSSEEIKIAYEENKELVYIDEKHHKYPIIVSEMFKKFKDII